LLFFCSFSFCKIKGSGKTKINIILKGKISLSGSNRVKRGGSWNNNANNVRSANRNNNIPDNSNNNLGFRPVNTGTYVRISVFKDAETVHMSVQISFLPYIYGFYLYIYANKNRYIRGLVGYISEDARIYPKTAVGNEYKNIYDTF
jgi:hypothetical protein